MIESCATTHNRNDVLKIELIDSSTETTKYIGCIFRVVVAVIEGYKNYGIGVKKCFSETIDSNRDIHVTFF